MSEKVENSHPASWNPSQEEKGPSTGSAAALVEQVEELDTAITHPASIPEHERDETKALQQKQLGNDLFVKRNFVQALEAYSEAILFAPLEKNFDKNRSIFYCNRAACLLELGRNDEAVKDCTQALEFDPNYVKALLRRSKAHEKLDQLEEALADLDAALVLEPNMKGLRQDRNTMDARVKVKHEQLKEEMFGKLKEMGNMVLGKFGLSVDNFKMEQDPNTGSYSINFKQ
jgi:tetratricopeptide (TPR) repeat protein